MKIKISNFGPIKEAELDLSKDLIMVYGENSVGKSYAIQVAYLVLKALSRKKTKDLSIESFINNIMEDVTPTLLENVFLEAIQNETFPVNDKDNKKLIKLEQKIKETKKVEITDTLNISKLEIMSKGLISEIETSLSNTFGNLKQIVNNTGKHPEIYICTNDSKIELVYKDNLELKRVFDSIYGISSNENKIERVKNKINIYINDKEPELNYLLVKLQLEMLKVKNNIVKQANSILNSIYFLPASRSGLYTGMSAFGQIVSELSKNRAYITSKIELPGIPEPVSDYFLELSNISTSQKQNTKFSRIADDIEQNILKGTIGFDPHRKELNYRPIELETPLELKASSSMVSELSSVVAFLKYVLTEHKDRKGKPIIFMEEPEAHLHPKAQVALSEIFVKLANAGVKLVITSHSNYIFNKFNNLVIAGELKPEQYAPIILKMEEEGSRGHLMELDELGVDDENFIEVSEKLYEEREELLEKLNEEADQ